MSWTGIHDDDYGWVAKLRAVQDGVAQDISTYTTLQMIFRKPDGTEVVKAATFTTDGTDGLFQYSIEDGVIDTPGEWWVQARLSKTGAELTGKALRFDVEPRLT